VQHNRPRLTCTRKVALNVEAALDRHNAGVAAPARLSASVGMHSDGAARIDDLLREADGRIYAAKRSRGRR